MLRIIASERAEQDGLKSDLDALVREGARRMLVAALKAEVDEHVCQHTGCVTRQGTRWWSAMALLSRGR
jgi:hypothetical protein